jgi:electron transport complex protein RnfE
MGVGFTLGLLCLGVVRELLGNGSLFGFRVLGDWFQEWTIMMLPPGGFFVLAVWLMAIHVASQRWAKAEQVQESVG